MQQFLERGNKGIKKSIQYIVDILWGKGKVSDDKLRCFLFPLFVFG